MHMTHDDISEEEARDRRLRSFLTCTATRTSFFYIRGSLLSPRRLFSRVQMSIQASQFLLLVTIVMFLPRFALCTGIVAVVRRRRAGQDRTVSSGEVHVPESTLAADAHIGLSEKQAEECSASFDGSAKLTGWKNCRSTSDGWKRGCNEDEEELFANEHFCE